MSHQDMQQAYNDGWNAGRQGKRDQSELWARDFGCKLASEYAAGYRDGEKYNINLSAPLTPLR